MGRCTATQLAAGQIGAQARERCPGAGANAVFSWRQNALCQMAGDQPRTIVSRLLSARFTHNNNAHPLRCIGMLGLLGLLEPELRQA
jgi:hypothetical protein